MAVERKTTVKKHGYQPRHKILPSRYRHQPQISDDVYAYQRWLLKKKADRENEVLPISVSEATTSHVRQMETPQWRPVRNPIATLLGLPTETRLRIYGYLSSATLIHVHSHSAQKFTWTPCKATNPDHPLLCLNPKWSGLCKESDRCTFKHELPPEPRGIWGIAAACKLLRHEALDLAVRDSTISIHPLKVSNWLRWMKKRAPKQLEAITKVTLAGPDHGRYCPCNVFQDLKDTLPNLSALGYQCQTPSYCWASTDKEQFYRPRRWEYWEIVEGMQIFAPTVTVVAEGMTWLKKRRLADDGGKKKYSVEKQGVVRLVRMGKKDGHEGMGWENADVNLETVQPRQLVEKNRNAEWRIWWKLDDLKFFGYSVVVSGR